MVNTNLCCIISEQSNWMRFVRAAGSFSEQNLVISQEGNQLFFTTTRSIDPKEELKVWYSVPYAKQRGLQSLTVSHNDGQGNIYMYIS